MIICRSKALSAIPALPAVLELTALEFYKKRNARDDSKHL